MRQRFLWLIILIVLLPVGLLTWFGVRFASSEKVVTQQRFQQLMQERLSDVNRQVSAQFEESERALQQLTAFDSVSIELVREIVRTKPQVSQVFVLHPNGELLYPQPDASLNVTERNFLQQASKMFTGKDLQNAVALREAELLRSQNPGNPGLGMSGVRPSVPSQSDSSFDPFGSSQQQPASEVMIVDAANSAPFQQPPTNDQVGNVEQPTRSVDLPQAPLPQAPLPQAPLPQAPLPQAPLPQAPIGMRALPLPDRGRAGQEIIAPGGVIPDVPAADGPGSNRLAPQSMRSEPMSARSNWPPSSGWFVWYWDRGMNLIYWQRRPSGIIVGAALERSRWISDLMCALPETDTSRSDAVSFRVVGSASETIYTWGPEWPRNAPAYCEVPLANPLASWRLQCFVPATLIPTSGGSLLFNLIAGLSAVTLTLSAMGWVLYRDYSRDLREASQQVSFVNQVSHELKTPLTNIRMYAELLENDLETILPDEQSGTMRNTSAGDPRRRLEVITSEAQRLSRLIGNVLTFARQQRNTLQLQPQSVQVVEVIRNILDRFAPSLSEHRIAATLTGTVEGTHRIDTDFLEQILGNLISNVEKYAADGQVLHVHVSSENDRLLIDIRDSGPGIPAQYREEIFRPFARLDNDVRSASGTGIGLTIARELARQHAGDLVLLNSDKGCWFQIQLRSV
ncbi:MAG: ATP-binding protein [Planctomycetaceae bacterium]